MNNLTLKIDQLVYGGRSIGRHNGKVVMISGAVLPGEVVEVNVERDRRDYTEASVLKILEPSADRIKPECKHFGICGGCNYQHIPYDLQVRLKEEIFKDCLRDLLIQTLTLQIRLSVKINGITESGHSSKSQRTVSDSTKRAPGT